MINTRVEKLTALMAQHQLDAVAIMPGPNMHYFTELSFHLSERPILALFLKEGDPGLIVPGFESFKAANSPHPLPWRIFSWDDEEGADQAFATACQALGLDGKRIGVETLAMRVKEHQLLLAGAPNPQITAADSLIEGMRQIKDAEEVQKMRAAVDLVEGVLAAVLPKVKIGMTEKEVAAQLLIGLFSAGSETLPFEPLVQTGPTGATPHASSGDRKLAAGDLLIIDVGARLDGYASDITRTFAVGEISDRAKQVYELVKQANAVGRQAVAPGVTCQSVDRAARKVIAEADHGEYFIHRTGHGLGLEGHEPPYIVEGNEALLEPGMTFTVEPGIYIQGVGGVRIEDNVVVTADGAEVLTSFDRELITVG